MKVYVWHLLVSKKVVEDERAREDMYEHQKGKRERKSIARVRDGATVLSLSPWLCPTAAREVSLLGKRHGCHHEENVRFMFYSPTNGGGSFWGW